MKEFWSLLKKFDLKGIFILPTTNGFLQFVRYAFVGGIATLVDWGVFYVLDRLHVYYLIAAAAGFIGGLIVNFILSKLLVFKASIAKTGLGGELLGYTLIGLAGLGITMGLMYIFKDLMGISAMLSKIISTFIVLLWNYFARKLLLYRKTEES